MSRGPIIREGVLSLVALCNVRGKDEESTRKLRRYVLGLALLSLTAPLSPEYRSGCILVPDVEAPSQVELVLRDGHRSSCDLGDVESFARSASEDFGVPKEPAGRTFDWKLVKKAVHEKKGKSGQES